MSGVKGQGATHGLTHIPEFKVWNVMIQRCTNPNNKQYVDYGGRGIIVSDEWKDFATFISDMGRRPNSKLTLERVNNDLGYNKNNCIWATQVQQNRNTRIYKNNTTGVKGVCPTGDGRYLAYVYLLGKCIRLGTHLTIEDAAKARKEGEAKYWNNLTKKGEKLCRTGRG